MSIVLNPSGIKTQQAQVLVPTTQPTLTSLTPYFFDIFISMMLLMTLLFPIMLIPISMFKAFGGLFGGVLK